MRYTNFINECYKSLPQLSIYCKHLGNWYYSPVIILSLTLSATPVIAETEELGYTKLLSEISSTSKNTEDAPDHVLPHKCRFFTPAGNYLQQSLPPKKSARERETENEKREFLVPAAVPPNVSSFLECDQNQLVMCRQFPRIPTSLHPRVSLNQRLVATPSVLPPPLQGTDFSRDLNPSLKLSPLPISCFPFPLTSPLRGEGKQAEVTKEDAERLRTPCNAGRIETLQAQLPPPLNPVEPKPPELPRPQLLPPPTQFLKPPTTPTSPSQPLPDNVPGTLTVEQFKVIGSTVFSAEKLAAVTAQFTKRPITFAELLQVQDAITQLYIKQGYVTSGAFIPPQALKNGIVTIEVLEGEVERIEVTGTRRLNPSYVRSRLARGTKTPLQVNRLVEALQVLQLNPLIETLKAELAAGSETGTSVLKVTVEEAPSFSARLRVDNGRSPSVGTVQRQIELKESNLLGLGDALTLAYTNTDGSNSIDEASYTLPLNARNGTLQFSYSWSDNHVIEQPFKPVDIESKARDYAITYRQPLIETPTQEFALGLSAVRRESDTSLLGEGYPLSPGANNRGETRISAIRFFQELTNRGSREVLALRSQFSLGLDVLGATTSNNPPNSQFFAWQGQAQYLRLLAPDTILLLRSDMQLANKALVPLEQFGLGGLNSVRGYRQDALLSDNGLFASAELRIPVARVPEWKSLLQITPFLEVGTAWNSSGRANPETNTLASAGLGLLWTVGDRFTARFDWGIPFVDLGFKKNTLQEKGLYFQVEYKPF